MKINITKGDVIWNYMGYFYRIAINLIMLPMMATFLAPKELGLWYTFISLGALANLLDFGFLPTISRNITYCWSGASEILKEGVTTSNSKTINFNLLNALLHTSKRIYLIISLSAGGLLISVGTIYIIYLTSGTDNSYYFIGAWIIFCFGIFFNIYYEYWNAFLKGTGLIKESQKAQVISISCQLILTAIGLSFNLNLIAISFAYLISGFVLRQMSKHYFYNKIIMNNIPLNFKKMEVKHNDDLFYKIWHNAKKTGLTIMGSFIITQGTTLLCSAFLGLEVTASYGLTLQLFAIVSTVSSLLYSSYTPAVNEARLREDNNKLRNIVSLSVCYGWVCFAFGWLFIIFFGDKILSILHSATPLLSKDIIAYMGLYLFLEFNHSFFTNVITTSNKIPFVKPSLISGLFILIFSILLLKTTSLGIWAIMISQSVVQLSYNNWKWPTLVFRELKINILSIFKFSFLFLYSKSKIYKPSKN